MVVNHLQIHLGLVCLEYFTTSAETMCHHSQLCKLGPGSIDDDDDDDDDNNQEEDSDVDDNGKNDDDFTFG